jgi:hypothetical protein
MSGAYSAAPCLATLRHHVERLEAGPGKVVTGQNVSRTELLDALNSAREVTTRRLGSAKAQVEQLPRGAA